jgi:hypothetical protein
MTGLLFAAAVLVAAVAAVRGMWSPCGLSMLTSLNPVAEHARGHRFGVTAAWYVAGAVLGGGALGAVCAAVAWPVGLLGASRAVVWSVVLGCSVIGVLSDARVTGRSLPDHPRQVDERWLDRYRRWIYAGGYGVQIGTGFATYIMTAAVYLTAALAVLTGDPVRAFTVCLAFGLVRGLVIVVCARAGTPDRLRSLLARVDALDAASLQVACAAQALVAALAVRVLGGGWAGAAVAFAVLVVLSMATPAGRRRTRAVDDQRCDVTTTWTKRIFSSTAGGSRNG